MTFNYSQWMQQVNRILVKKCGMDADMLPDYCYLDAYRAGDTPEEVAQDAIDNARDY